MQIPPLTYTDISLLLAMGAIILFITAEYISPHCGQTNLTINKRKLKNAATAAGTLFLINLVISVISIITGT